jgi:hypothetical protein
VSLEGGVTLSVNNNQLLFDGVSTSKTDSRSVISVNSIQQPAAGNSSRQALDVVSRAIHRAVEEQKCSLMDVFDSMDKDSSGAPPCPAPPLWMTSFCPR